MDAVVLHIKKRGLKQGSSCAALTTYETKKRMHATCMSVCAAEGTCSAVGAAKNMETFA